MQPQKIVIPNNNGQKLVGYLYTGSSKTLLLVCHGLHSFRDFPEVKPYLEEYTKIGCAVFSFDFTGFGESQGKKNFSIQQRVADVGSVIEFFHKKYPRVILYGVSLGAPAAVISAIKYPSVKAMVVINGAFNFWQVHMKLLAFVLIYMLLHREQRSEAKYLRENLLPQKITIPTLVVSGEKDKIVSPKQSMNFYNKLVTEKELLVIPNGDHILLDKKYKVYLPKIAQWIVKCVA